MFEGGGFGVGVTVTPLRIEPRPVEAVPPLDETLPATTGSNIAAKRAPSGPPTGTTAPPSKPASGGPARTAPSAAPAQSTPRPVAEPEPIDLLEVAGGAAMARYAAPAAGIGAVLLLVALVVRRRRRRR